MAVHVASRSRLLSWYSCKKRVKCIGTVLTTVYWHADRMLQCLMGEMAPCCEVVGAIWLGGLPSANYPYQVQPGSRWRKCRRHRRKGGSSSRLGADKSEPSKFLKYMQWVKKHCCYFPHMAFGIFFSFPKHGKPDSRQKRTKGWKKSPEKIKEKN